MKLKYANTFLTLIITTAFSHAATPILSTSDFSGQLSGTPFATVDGTDASASQGNASASSISPPLNLVQNNGNLSYDGNSSVSIFKNAGGNNVTDNAVSVVQTIAFDLGVNEIADIDFSADYAFTFADTITGSISWSLVGPSSNSIFSGSVDTGANSINASVTDVTGAGTYTLTITSSLAGGIQTAGATTAATLTNTQLVVTAIPEPSTIFASLLGLSAFIFRRRR